MCACPLGVRVRLCVCVYWCWLAYTYMQACRSYSILLFVCRVLHFHVVVVLFTQFRYPCFTQYIRCRKHAHALVLSLSTGWLFSISFLYTSFFPICASASNIHIPRVICVQLVSSSVPCHTSVSLSVSVFLLALIECIENDKYIQ